MHDFELTTENWRDDERLSDHDAADSIKEHLAAARKLAAKRRWHGITEGIDNITTIMAEE